MIKICVMKLILGIINVLKDSVLCRIVKIIFAVS